MANANLFFACQKCGVVLSNENKELKECPVCHLKFEQ
jgi:rubrerythrin